MAYAGALLSSYYAALDRQEWAAVGALLTPDVRWHVLSSDRVAAGSVTGRDATAAWLAEALGGFDATVRTLDAVHDEGTAAAVFSTATTTRAGQSATAVWLDSFRFADGLIAEHVSLQVG